MSDFNKEMSELLNSIDEDQILKIGYESVKPLETTLLRKDKIKKIEKLYKKI